MIPLVTAHALRLSSRLPVVLQPGRDRLGRPVDVRHRQSRSSVHPGRHLRQGARVRRARPFSASRADAAAAGGAEGPGRAGADLVGRGHRDDRRPLAGDHRARGRRSDSAVLVRRLDGSGPVPRRPSALSRAGRATLGFDRLSEHLRAYTPEAVAPIVGLDADTIVRFARRYGATPRTFIRIGIGLSRHDNGAMTCRTLACLPALTGAYADPHGGALLSTGGAYGFDYSVLERPDLMPTPAPRIINMIQLGRALTDPTLTPPVRSLYVYSSNPAAVCPDQTLVLRGLAREDLFTVVHEQVLTDTAHYADIVLPATTSMEHLDLYRSFGQLTLQLARPALAPQGEAKSNWETSGLLARAMGVAETHYAKGDEGLIREFLAKGDASVRGVTWEQLDRDGWVRVNLPRPYMPFANGAPTPSGKVEFYSAWMERQGLPALPTYVPLAEGPDNRELVARFPLQCIVPPNRFFLNSSFSQSELLRRRQGAAIAMLAAADAAARGIGDGDSIRVESPRGAARFTARITDATRPGVVVIEGIWWHRFSPDGLGVNVLTSDRVADLGGGPAFHSNLVQVSKV